MKPEFDEEDKEGMDELNDMLLKREKNFSNQTK